MKGDYLIHRRDRPTGVHTSFICVTCLSPTHVRCDGVSSDQE